MAALSISMAIKPRGDDERTVVAEPSDMVAFEREFQKSISSLQENVFLTDLFWLAWHAEKRTKATKLEFDAWIDTVESIDLTSEADELVPLENSPSTG